MALKSFRLPAKVGDYKFSTPADIGDLKKGLYETHGDVSYVMLPQINQQVKYVLVDRILVDNPRNIHPKKIEKEIAQRLADLGPISTLFTLDIWKNVAFIPHFTNIVSLQDILGVQDTWPFETKHIKILVADVGVPPHSLIFLLTSTDARRLIQSAHSQIAE